MPRFRKPREQTPGQAASQGRKAYRREMKSDTEKQRAASRGVPIGTIRREIAEKRARIYSSRRPIHHSSTLAMDHNVNRSDTWW